MQSEFKRLSKQGSCQKVQQNHEKLKQLVKAYPELLTKLGRGYEQMTATQLCKRIAQVVLQQKPVSISVASGIRSSSAPGSVFKDGQQITLTDLSDRKAIRKAIVKSLSENLGSNAIIIYRKNEQTEPVAQIVGTTIKNQNDKDLAVHPIEFRVDALGKDPEHLTKAVMLVDEQSRNFLRIDAGQAPVISGKLYSKSTRTIDLDVILELLKSFLDRGNDIYFLSSVAAQASSLDDYDVQWTNNVTSSSTKSKGYKAVDSVMEQPQPLKKKYTGTVEDQLWAAHVDSIGKNRVVDMNIPPKLPKRAAPVLPSRSRPGPALPPRPDLIEFDLFEDLPSRSRQAPPPLPSRSRQAPPPLPSRSRPSPPPLPSRSRPGPALPPRPDLIQFDSFEDFPMSDSSSQQSNNSFSSDSDNDLIMFDADIDRQDDYEPTNPFNQSPQSTSSDSDGEENPFSSFMEDNESARSFSDTNPFKQELLETPDWHEPIPVGDRKTSLAHQARLRKQVVRRDSPLIHPENRHLPTSHHFALTKACSSKARGNGSLTKQEVIDLYRKWGKDPTGKTVDAMCKEMIDYSLIDKKK